MTKLPYVEATKLVETITETEIRETVLTANSTQLYGVNYNKLIRQVKT